MFFINKLPTLNHIVFNSRKFDAVSDNKFFIMIDFSDPIFSEKDISLLLKQSGSTYIETVES